MAALDLGDHLPRGRAHDLVAETDGTAAHLGDVRADDQIVVVVGGRFVAAVRFGDDEGALSVLLHLAVRETARAAELGAPHLGTDLKNWGVDHAPPPPL